MNKHRIPQNFLTPTTPYAFKLLSFGEAESTPYALCLMPFSSPSKHRRKKNMPYLINANFFKIRIGKVQLKTALKFPYPLIQLRSAQ